MRFIKVLGLLPAIFANQVQSQIDNRRNYLQNSCIKDQEYVDKLGLKEAIATSYNLSKIIEKMKKCGVKKARVAGWNDHIGTFVVSVAGTVTPPVPYDFPREKVYTTLCNPADNPETADAYILVQGSCGASPSSPSMKPNPLPLPLPAPAPAPCNNGSCDDWKGVDGFLCACTGSSNDSSCDCCEPIVIESCTKKSSCGVSTKSYNCKGRKYEYRTKFINGKKHLALVLKERSKSETEKVYILDKNPCVGIEILKDPKKLKAILQLAKRQLCADACLYVDDRSRIYVLCKDGLYIHIQDCSKLKRLSSNDKDLVMKKGLYLVEFRE